MFNMKFSGTMCILRVMHAGLSCCHCFSEIVEIINSTVQYILYFLVKFLLMSTSLHQVFIQKVCTVTKKLLLNFFLKH
jgi:hypothetical protein